MTDLIRGFAAAEAAHEAQMPWEPTAAQEAAAEAVEYERELHPAPEWCPRCGDQAVCPDCTGGDR